MGDGNVLRNRRERLEDEAIASACFVTDLARTGKPLQHGGDFADRTHRATLVQLAIVVENTYRDKLNVNV